MKKGVGSECTIIIGLSKSVYAIYSLEHGLGLAQFRVFVPNIYIYIYQHLEQKYNFCDHYEKIVSGHCRKSSKKKDLFCDFYAGIVFSHKNYQDFAPFVLITMKKLVFGHILKTMNIYGKRTFLRDYYEKN